MEKAEHWPTLVINDTPIRAGQRLTIDLPVARLYTHTRLTLPLHVVCGKRPGPRLFVSAAIHGDEINGVEIIRRLLRVPLLSRLRGTLVAIPVVNVYGFIHHSRYLPDRRDLNRSFPGSVRGSLTARLAHLFMDQVVSKCQYGIDLHTGAVHRTNLPQIRAQLDDPETEQIARVFGVPVLLNSTLRDGSLRQAAAERGIRVLLYEGGEALRFDELSIRAGFRGILAVMRKLGMLPASRPSARAAKSHRMAVEPVLARTSTWIRAPESGVLRSVTRLGARVRKGDLLAMIADPFGEREFEVRTTANGVVIGRVNLPLASEGEALFHIAEFEQPRAAAAKVEAFQASHMDSDELLPDEPPIT